MRMAYIIEHHALRKSRSAYGEGDAGKTRERLLNDLINTGVTAALVGGFALGNIYGSERVSNDWQDVMIYMLSFVAVHACTCSALTSAMFYRSANVVHEDELTQWIESKAFLLKLPWLKFVVGCLSYIISVIILSVRALEQLPFWQYASVVFGVMSMSMVFASMILIGRKHAPRYSRHIQDTVTAHI